MRWGYVPTDQRRAVRGFWIFGTIMATIALAALILLVVRAVA